MVAILGVQPSAIARAVPKRRPSPALSDAEFRRVRALMHRLSGVDLRPGKEALVRSRLSRRLRATGASSYTAYLDLVEGADGAAEREAFVDALTTNKTSF